MAVLSAERTCQILVDDSAHALYADLLASCAEHRVVHKLCLHALSDCSGGGAGLIEGMIALDIRVA